VTQPTGLFAAIGNTPLVKLSSEAGSGQVWVKLEGANPTGSYKDRMALAMIVEAEAAGKLQPGQAVVEYTGGSTGSSLAFVCALTNHPLYIVTADAFAVEKLRTMEAFGAELEILSSPEGVTPGLIPRMRKRAAEIAEAKGAYQTDQFNNTDMVAGYIQMGEEIAAALPRVDGFCSYVGTAGCFLGVTRGLAAKNPDMLRVVVEPTESAVISGSPAGTHRIEGGGVGFVPEQLHSDTYDEVETVSTSEAIWAARAAARTHGLFSGPSTGANLIVARRLAARMGEKSVMVTVQVDTGLKYLSGSVYS